MAHIVAYVDKNMELPVENRSVFKLTEAVTTYDAVFMMKLAWDVVTTLVVLNSWLRTEIISP